MSRKHRNFKRFFCPKLGDLQKKKKKKKKKKRSSPKFRVIFRPKSEIQTFFLPKIRWSPKKKKKKKVFAKIQSDFSAEIRNSNVFSAQNQVISKKKKKVFAKIHGDFSPNFATLNVWGGAIFEWGGLFSIFHTKSASKAQKTCVFAYFTTQWGGPPAPPWLRYWEQLISSKWHRLSIRKMGIGWESFCYRVICFLTWMSQTLKVRIWCLHFSVKAKLEQNQKLVRGARTDYGALNLRSPSSVRRIFER